MGGSVVFCVREMNSGVLPPIVATEARIRFPANRITRGRVTPSIRFGNVARAAELAEESGGRKTAVGDLWGGREAG